jgi:transcriptional regulator with XRE-family HTH domain
MNDAETPESGTKTMAVQRFAAELRAQRQLRGWTQAVLANKIKYSGSFVSDVERCNRLPSLDFARACDREMHLPGTFVRFHEAIGAESFAPWFAPALPFEAGARKIHDWDMRFLDGLLQTEEYARAVMRACNPDDREDMIERDVAARMERQCILSHENPTSGWFITTEAVLRAVFGSHEIMGGQLDKLIELAGRPGFVIQVLPLTAMNCPCADGPMTIFDMPDGMQVGYVEGSEVGRIIEAPNEVARLRARFDLLRVVALPPAESANLIKDIRSEYGE